MLIITAKFFFIISFIYLTCVHMYSAYMEVREQRVESVLSLYKQNGSQAGLNIIYLSYDSLLFVWLIETKTSNSKFSCLNLQSVKS